MINYLTSNNLNYKLHIDTPIRETFNALVKSQILILSRSSFSYAAGLLNENDIVATNIKSWWHKPLKQWHIF